MGHGGVQVVIWCLVAMLYTGLGLLGASRVWESRASTTTKERSPHLAILSGVMNVISVVVLLAQIATMSAGGVFPCGITSTVSHMYVLLCLLPLVLRKSGDAAIWGNRKIIPASSAAVLLGTGSPLLASQSRYRFDATNGSARSERASSPQQRGGACEDQDEKISQASAAVQALLRTKLAATALVVLVGTVTALSIWAGGGNWSIRGRYRDKDGSCLPLESWHLVSSWATCATVAGVSYATTVDPERPYPRARGRDWKQATAGVREGATGQRLRGSGSMATPWWLQCFEWRRQPCLLRREKLVVSLVSAWFGGVYVSLLWKRPKRDAEQRNGFLVLLVVMNAFLLLSTFWLVAVESMSRVKPLTAFDLMKVRQKWGSTKDIMSNPDVAAKFRDAARARFCEELYKFLAAFQQFEDMNFDEEIENGGERNGVRPFIRPPLRKKEEPSKNQRQHRSYQVPRYSVYVGMLGEFFTPGCRHEVNVSSETRHQVRKLVKFCDWVASSEEDKRRLFARAANEARMMLDQNVLGSFIQSSTFAGVAQDLIVAENAAAQEKTAQEKSAKRRSFVGEQKRLELKNTMKKAFHTVAVTNSAKIKWAKVAAEGSDARGAGSGSDTPKSAHSDGSVSGAATAPSKALTFRSVALGVLATSRYTALKDKGDRDDHEELPPLSVTVSAPPKSATGTSTMANATSAPLRPTPSTSPSPSSASSAVSAPSIPSMD